MRRGLISRSKAELPDAVLEARIARLRAAMGAAGLDKLIVYTNNTRPAGVSWLTGFVPYWSEALLVVSRDGAPVLVAALSHRVKGWIEATSCVGEVMHSPRIGFAAAGTIAASKADAAVGIADLEGLPAGIFDDLREGGPHLILSDATALFAPLRSTADSTEIALAMKAAAIAQRALAQASPRASLGEIIAAVEARARGDGAEEIYVAAAPDLKRDRRFRRIEGEAAVGDTFAVRATVAYKGTWVRVLRTLTRDRTVPEEEATARLASAVAKLPSEDGFAGFSSWLVEGCRIAQPLEPLMGSRVGTLHPLAPGALVSVQASLEIDGAPLLIGAPALIGKDGEAASLLVQPF
jgi:Creatinase/Prolidase N-terminal domain